MAVDPRSLSDPGQVRSLLENAKRLGREDLVEACVDRLIELGALGSAQDPVEIACWKGIFAAEEFASRAKGRTVKLNRTRQKIARVGIVATISDLAGSPKVHQGFEILAAGGRLDLTFEAISLRFPSIFPDAVRKIAFEKLRNAGYPMILTDQPGTT